MIMDQLVITNIEEDVLASRLRNVLNRLQDLVTDLEARAVTREEILGQVRDVEKGLRQTRQRF